MGHARSELGWQEVPFDPLGAFAPMGGAFSSVRDLARWIGELTDAFPPRDDPEGGHPLRRATRREQQQPHRAYPPEVVWHAVDAPPVVRAAAYGFGLVVDAHPRYGTLVGHSGGYPGFGSHMRWHPDSRLGVVVLANSTYAAAYVLAEQILDVVLAGRTAGESSRGARARAGTGRPVARDRGRRRRGGAAAGGLGRRPRRPPVRRERGARRAPAWRGAGGSQRSASCSARSHPIPASPSSTPPRPSGCGGCAAPAAGSGSRSG